MAAFSAGLRVRSADEPTPVIVARLLRLIPDITYGYGGS
jgi:hypothetical protein